jgi:hypothetical protein
MIILVSIGVFYQIQNYSAVILELALNEATENDFVLIDPPDLERLGYHQW